ncbi:MAG: polyphosphate kinase 2 family protein [Acidobacteria bacterium]|nr:MAG: polyphosphate kinase 2 family protein [Acidobacteriota bacterium]
MFEAVTSPFRVPFDGSFRLAGTATAPPPPAPDAKSSKRRLRRIREQLAELQRILYAHDRHAVLLIFQAMDAAGKDSTIRKVTSGINPAGFQVFSFKKPSAEELDHDFLWRTSCRLPERGRIGIFNRSYYEEVLVVRVHPQLLERQALPELVDLGTLWQQRFESIRDHELHLARNGVVIVKFFLNVSREEQRRRFLSRLDEPHKNWKFAPGDVRERGFWDDYQRAYEEALAATSRPWAPWYAVPADDKPFMRLTVADLLLRTLQSLELRYPEVDHEHRAIFDRMRAQLEAEGR